MKKIIRSLLISMILLLTGCNETSSLDSTFSTNDSAQDIESSSSNKGITINDAIVLNVYENNECILLWDNSYFLFSHLKDPKVGDSYNLTFDAYQQLVIYDSFPQMFGDLLISYELVSSVEKKEGMHFMQYVNFDNENMEYYIDEIIYYEAGTLITDAVSSYAEKNGTSLQDYFLSYMKDDIFAEMNPNYIEKYSLEGKYLTDNITIFDISN